MTLTNFAIEIVSQGWVTHEPDSVQDDLCSHGDIRLAIGGRAIAQDYGATISTSALALLRTLESDHSSDADECLVLCCGMILMTSCPRGINWSVSHLGGRVRLHDVVRYDSTDVTQAVRFSGVAVELAEDEYRRQVVAFAEKAKQLFAGIEKRPGGWERKLYEEFWQEYEGRLSRTAQ